MMGERQVQPDALFYDVSAQPGDFAALGAIGLFELVDLGKQPDHAPGKRVERAIVVTR